MVITTYEGRYNHHSPDVFLQSFSIHPQHGNAICYRQLDKNVPMEYYLPSHTQDITFPTSFTHQYPTSSSTLLSSFHSSLSSYMMLLHDAPPSSGQFTPTLDYTNHTNDSAKSFQNLDVSFVNNLHLPSDSSLNLIDYMPSCHWNYDKMAY